MTTANDLLSVARELHRGGNLADAAPLYRQVLDADPNNHIVLHLLGIVTAQLGQRDAGIDYLTRAVSLCPNDATYQNSLGEVYLTARRGAEARQCFEQALRLDPRQWAAHFNLGLLTGIDAPDEAQGHYERTIAAAPEFVPAHINLGNVLRAQGKLEDAVAAYRAALALQPNDCDALANLGRVLTSLERLDEANDALQTAIGLSYYDVSHRYRCVFIHIPKNAGTSIRRALGIVGGGHRPWRFHAQSLPQVWQQYLSFAVVRNPWDRAASAFHHARMPDSHWHRQQGTPHPDYQLLADKSFEDCLRILCEQPGRLIHEAWTDQSQWILDMQSPAKPLMVHSVLRYETLDDDFAKLCNRLHVESAELPVLNTSDRARDYRSFYNEASRKMVEQLYADDIRAFGYTF